MGNYRLNKPFTNLDLRAPFGERAGPGGRSEYLSTKHGCFILSDSIIPLKNCRHESDGFSGRVVKA